MLNSHAYLILADSTRISPTSCQRTLRLFADFDLSVSRVLIPDELDARYSWPRGATTKLLLELAGNSLGILLPPVRRVKSRLPERWICCIASEWLVPARTLAEQRKHQQEAKERLEMVQ
jgi:hypothetical protein